MKQTKGDQISLFDLISFDECKKTQEQKDIDFFVQKGSSFEKGKLRIINFYQMNDPNIFEFSVFLRNEYGHGGWNIGYASEEHSPKGIKIIKDGRRYSFSWNEWAKKVAEKIDSNSYVLEKDLPRPEYFKIPNPPAEIYPFNYLQKTYYFSSSYKNEKIIAAHLSSITETDVKNVRFFESYSCVNDYVYIGIHELMVGIESGAYESIEEIWLDIRKSGRMISPSIFGGKKWLDEDGIKHFFENYKKTGSCIGTRPEKVYTHHEERHTFYGIRLRVKKGDLSPEYLLL